jgi:asparagine synthase (glutamine-hydrolysing)
MLYSDFNTWLVDDLLIKANKMTMTNSVELRVHFLDYRVVEHAATIPSRMKIRRGEPKWILKQAMRNRLPDAILTRKKRDSLRLSPRCSARISPAIWDLLLSSRCTNRGYFRRDAIEGFIQEHAQKKKDNQKQLWQLAVLEEWHRKFTDIPQPASR